MLLGLYSNSLYLGDYLSCHLPCHHNEIICCEKTTRRAHRLITLWLSRYSPRRELSTPLLWPEAFNKYGHALTSNPLIYVAEAGLLVLFLAHMGTAIKVTLQNKAARPERYYMKSRTGRGSTFASSSMPYTGFILLAFIIFHLQGLKFGEVYNVTYDGVVMRDLYRLTFEKFSTIPYVSFYVISMFAMGVHLSHGF